MTKGNNKEKKTNTTSKGGFSAYRNCDASYYQQSNSSAQGTSNAEDRSATQNTNVSFVFATAAFI